MNAYSQTLKNILSDKRVTAAILFIVIASRAIQLLFFYNIRVDGMYQVVAMQNFIHGHGISIGNVLPSNLSYFYYEPLINWPPGYSLMMAPFYLLFNHNYILAGIIMDLLFAVLLIFTGRKILKLLDTPLFLVNLFALSTGFFIYFFYYINSSDAIAISIFLIGIFYTLKLVKTKQFSSTTAAGLMLPLFLAGFIKYLFIPVVFIIPVCLLIYGLVNKEKLFIKAGVLSAVVLSTLFTGLLLYQKEISGTAFYISQPERGFFPDNLSEAYPTIPAAFLMPDSAAAYFDSFRTGRSFYRILQIINFVLLTGMLVIIVKKIFGRSGNPIITLSFLIILTALLLAGITVMLAILSISVAKEENFPGNLWTYIEEPRYYGLITVLIHISIFASLPSLMKKFNRSFPAYLLLLLLIPETTRGVVFTANRISRFNNEEYIWQLEYKLQKLADDIINKNRKENEITVVTGSMYYLNYRVSLFSHAGIMNNASAINKPGQIKTTKPTLLLVIIYEKDVNAYLPFIESNKIEVAGYKDGFYFYTLHVSPE